MFRFQTYISRSYAHTNFNILRNFQRLVLSSLSSRFRIIRNIIFLHSRLFNFSNSFGFTSYDKLFLFVSLGYSFYYYNFYPFFFSKTKGLSFFFEIPHIFVSSLTGLSNLALSPLIELFSDKAIFLYRPYRNSYDLILFLKQIFNLNILNFWISNYQFYKFSLQPFWLIKNVLLDKKILFFWISNFPTFSSDFNFMYDFKGTSFYFSILGFLLNGLVLIVKPIILFFAS